jgi:mannose-6-phosphate isomerase
VAARFGELPFLAKVLAAAGPLSIQAHPNPEQAAAGFAREELAGLALDSPRRIYRDARHKPEIMCALTRFEAKCGFRDLAATQELFGRFADRRLDPLRNLLASSGRPGDLLGEVMRWLLAEPARSSEGPDLASVVAKAASVVPGGGPFAEELRWTAEIATAFPGDVGVVVALLLNHVLPEPGEAIFLGAGTLHSYLRGAGIEVMANSDNVVRGGLSDKHIDTEELLIILDTNPTVPLPTSTSNTYLTPVPEFSLTRYLVDGTREVESTGPEIVLATEGQLTMTDCSTGAIVELAVGRPVFDAGNEGNYWLRGSGTAFRAGVGRCLSSESR